MPALPDAHKRKRIGPWEEDALPSLEHFEPDRNFVVRASAGSGKTTALVARMVALVRQGVPPGDMAAITFTRKAAGEMRQRFFRELRKARSYLQGGTGREAIPAAMTDAARQRQLQRVEDALGAIQQCFIGTIHSFCARILREHAIEVGLPPDFVAGLDDRDEQELRERVWQNHLEDTWTNDVETIEHFDDLNVDVGALERVFGALCGHPDLVPYTDGPSSMPDLEDAAADARSFVREYAPYLVDPEPDANAGKVSTALRQARRFLKVRSLDDPATRAEFLELFEGTKTEDRRKSTDTAWRGDMTNKGTHWTDAEVADALDNAEIPSFVEEVVEPALAAWRAYGHRYIMEFLQPAVQRFRDRRREEGRLTFIDLLVETRRLLRETPAVRERLQDRFPRILVDEFQDTDPIQAELLFYLTGARTAEQDDWTRCQPRPGSLFIVGDDQQSIYGFRRADMRVFNQVKDLLATPEGDNILQLESNFRSLGPICDWCDEAFGDLLAEGVEAGIQAEHQPFSATRSAAGGPHVKVLEVPDISFNPAEDIARKNARQIAEVIERSIGADEPFLSAAETDGAAVKGRAEDFMILTRNKPRLSIFAEELASRDIPYALTGGQDLGDSSELRALVDLLSCIRRPDDPVARVAYLRGALVGLSDDDLYRLRAAGYEYDHPQFELPEGVAADLTTDLARRMRRALEHLRRSETLLAECRPASAIGQIIDRTGLFGRALDDPVHGSLRAGRLSRLLARIRGLDHRALHWTEVLDELHRLADGDTDADGLTLDAGTGGAVRLLNVHKAKGLEAPVVILADPYHSKYPRAPSQYVDRAPEEGEPGRVVLPIHKQKTWSKEFRWGPRAWRDSFKDQAKQEQEAEERRLQYVAATRAEDCLIVSRYAGKDEEGFWANLYPYLDDCPTLTTASAEEEAAPSETEQRPLPIPDLDTIFTAREAAGAHVPTYATQQVTEQLGADQLLTGAYGKEFGIAVHDLFERVVTEPEAPLSDDAVRHILRMRTGIEDEAQVQNARSMIRRFRQSDLFASVRAAETVVTELPISGSPANPDADTTDSILKGKIDLAYRDAEGWHLADYKTSAVRDNLDTLAAHYAPQLRSYADLWAQQTGTPPQSTLLWFADTGDAVHLTP